MKIAFYLKFTYILLTYLALSVYPAYAQDKNGAVKTPDSHSDNPLISIIGELADRKTFQKNSTSIDYLLSKYCDKAEQNRTDLILEMRYICKPESRIDSIYFEAMNNKSIPNYLIIVNIKYQFSDYPKIKKLVLEKLGKPNSLTANSIGWSFKPTRNTRDYGTPTIYTVRDKETNSAVFTVAVEQPDQ